MRNTSFLFFVVILLTSCISSKEIIKYNSNENIEISNIDLNGVYLSGDELWKTLHKNHSYKDYRLKGNADSKVRLKMLTKKKMKVDFIQKEMLVNSFILKGKLKNGYYSVNRKLLFFYTPFFGFHIENKVLLGLNKDKNLIIIDRSIDAGWLLIGGKETFDGSDRLYKRIKN